MDEDPERSGPGTSNSMYHLNRYKGRVETQRDTNLRRNCRQRRPPCSNTDLGEPSTSKHVKYEHHPPSQTLIGARSRDKKNTRKGPYKPANDNRAHQSLKLHQSSNKPPSDRTSSNLKKIGFNKLRMLAESPPELTLNNIMATKTAFIELIDQELHRKDLFVLFLKCIAKISQSPFFQTKCELLFDICRTNFLSHLKQYLLELPYQEHKALNDLYWHDQNSFWKNLIIFMEFITQTSPSLTVKVCRPIVEGIILSCLEGLKQRHDYHLPDECSTMIKDIKKKIIDVENYMKRQQQPSSSQKNLPNNELPPDDFRQLSLYPTKEDLLHNKPFVRPNIVNGAYQDVEHYLDVQFRLLREDCFGPVRIGLNQFLENPNQKRYNNIRVFRNVKFIQPYITTNKMGLLVKLDINNISFMKRLVKTKRFKHGALVLFTKDNCKNIIVATIIDCEEENLQRGLIPVKVVQGENTDLYKHPYVMIESDVYFEPYYNVLKALKGLSYEREIPMQKYIVEVNSTYHYPSYLLKKEDNEYTFNKNIELYKCHDILDENSSSYDDITSHENVLKFNVKEDETWPTKDSFGFDESQYEAFKLALRHEFAVIQGPPGTGKTYVGIKIAQTLYENLIKDVNGCLMLIICYTNHALDQFLEAILKFTESVVRIGNQSKNDAMKCISLTTLRKTIRDTNFINIKQEMRCLMNELNDTQTFLDVLLNGVIKINQIDKIEARYLEGYYNKHKDPLIHWLFCDYPYYMEENVHNLIVQQVDSEAVNFEKQNRKRTDYNVEDEETDDVMQKYNEIAIFSVSRKKKEKLQLIKQFKKTNDSKAKCSILSELQYIDAHIKLFEDMKTICERSKNKRIPITARTNFDAIKTKDRWHIYFTWIQTLIEETKHKFIKLQEKFETTEIKYDEVRMMADIEVIREKKVIGMTTSGAAKLRKILLQIAPPIIMVEEAAEVLEQHVVASLTPKCNHLILIGDHQQLQPSSSNVKLAKYYKMEVSLFERMIKNGIHSRCLGVQHRMRPEIAALIAPHIYESLENHNSVYNFPDVRGMTKNVFFFTHDYKEDEQEEENMSRTNCQEADLVLGLANYLMKQGYSPDTVTILTTYKGQMFYMRKKSQEYCHLTNVNITVVDNYQGEESEIILLSLVRNNEENDIGFLATQNRICVAVSRAKYGFYIFGNIHCLKARSELWTNISNTLESNNSLGSTLTLKCENHPNNTIEVNRLEDFNQTPEGGCNIRCEFPLPQCDHKCELVCHGYDREHKSSFTACRKKCERVLCEFQHICPKQCYDICGPCEELVPKILPCGHEANLFCHLEADDPQVKCKTKFEVTLPDCGHKTQKYCYEDVNDIKCREPCGIRLDKCGHTCGLKCHVKDDPEHNKYICQKPCAKLKSGCSLLEENAGDNHRCPKRCYEECDECEVKVLKKKSNCTHLVSVSCNIDVNTIPCEEKCKRMAQCGKHFCQNKCKDPCICQAMVSKEIPDCKHKISVKCSVEPSKKMCVSKCSRTLKCGHKCRGFCKDECDDSTCTEPSDRPVKLPCGHTHMLPCNLSKLPMDRLEEEMVWMGSLVRSCASKCGVTLECGHQCAGTCGRCANRLHAPCIQPCHRLNICGHRCNHSCNQVCPPCREKCEIKCAHNRCGKPCATPCTFCQEACVRRCVHSSCDLKCGQKCSRAPCSERCTVSLACGHACSGLCGEPCPPACRRCHPEDYPTDILGDDLDDDARLILLEDCGHIMDVDFVDNIVRVRQDVIQLPKCPMCRKPIINTGRYKDSIMELYKKEINPIKKRVYGSYQEIAKLKKELTNNLKEFGVKYQKILKANVNCFMLYQKLNIAIEKKNSPSKLDLDMGLICFNILQMITEELETYLPCSGKIFDIEFKSQMDFITRDVTLQLKKYLIFVSQQQQKDLALEIKRLHYIVQYTKLNIPPVKLMPDSVLKVYKDTNKFIFSYSQFEEKKAIESLQELQKILRLTTVISPQEREMIVKAINLKAGHWYKCPNGHYYCIGECGGAMQLSKCNECGAQIGGTQHTLTAGNVHASEMDGSQFAAWSEEYNNMRNFIL